MGVVPKGVNNHGGGDEEEQDEVNRFGVDDPGVLNEMHRVGDEEGERPAAADEGAGEDTVAIAALEVNAGAKNNEAHEVAESDFFRIS